MRMTSYFRSLVKSGTLDSSKSFALLLSVIIGAIIGLVVCFCLIWDVVTNGYIKTNLNELECSYCVQVASWLVAG